MTHRFHDSGQSIDDFEYEFLVRCPRCRKRARVTPMFAPQPEVPAYEYWHAPRRCVCPHCGYIQEWHNTTNLEVGGAFDWYFHLPLWLQTPCCGHILWAYNARHLAFLEACVRAPLRERLTTSNRTLASRLPAWMKSGQNREDVLAGIARLQQMLVKEMLK
jgi:hypothetical protein